MFSSYNQMKASLPDYTEDLAKNFGIAISREALHKKFSPKAVEFMKEVLKLQLAKQFKLEEIEGLRSCSQAVNIKAPANSLYPRTMITSTPALVISAKKWADEHTI